MPESDKLYHADVVAVEQNFGQLDVTLGGITRKISASIRMLSDCPHIVDVHLRHIFKNHVCED
jgi:hypothetical protein